jgi:hypothetical protein
MGRVGDGHFVSGVTAAVAGANTPAPPPPPFTASVYWNGQSPLPVSSASGVAQTVNTPTFYPNVIVFIASGGVTPYTSGPLTITSNPSGKLSLATNAGGDHTTVAWTGMAINETQTIELAVTMSDSAGASIPFTMQISVRRVS